MILFKRWLSCNLGKQDIFEQLARETEDKKFTQSLLSNIENILLNDRRLILDNIFSITCFDSIEDEIFRQLVISRLKHQMSKSATVDYLKSHFEEEL